MKLFSRTRADGPGRRWGRAGRLALSVGLLLPAAASLGAFASVLNASPASASIPFTEVGGTFYTPVVPTRIADTRANSGYQGAGDTLTAGQILQVDVTGGLIPGLIGADFVPADATAVVLNITAVNPTSNGYLTAFASGQTLPLASTVNFLAGQTIANEATITIGANNLSKSLGDDGDGFVDIYNYTGSTDVVVDVQGFYFPGDTETVDGVQETLPDTPFSSWYYPISYPSPVTNAIDNAPVRVLDTRPGSGQQGAGQTIGPDSQITFFPGTSTFAPSLTLVPLNATAVVLNVTEATNTAASYLTAWATGFGQPLASDLNWQAGDPPVANRVIVPYNPATQTVSIFNWAGSTDVVADLDGYFAPESELGIGNFELTGCPIKDTQTLTFTPSATETGSGHFSLTEEGGNTTGAISDIASAAAISTALSQAGIPASAVGGSVSLGTGPITLTESGFPLELNADPATGVTISDPVLNITGSCPGFFAGSVYYGLTAPNRIADTRPQTTVPYALSTLGALSILDVFVPPDAQGPFSGFFAPSNFDGVDVNVTVTDTTAASYLEIFPAEAGFGLTATQAGGHPASDINWKAGEIISNGDLVAEVSDIPLPSIDLFNWAGTTDAVVDVYGYFALDPVLSFDGGNGG